MKKRIQVNQLQIGMFVEELDRPWLGTPFFLEGVDIRTEEEIRTLQRLCRYVYITVDDNFQGGQVPMQQHKDIVQQKSHSTSPHKRLAEFSEALVKAREIRDHSQVLVDTMHEDIKHGRKIDTEGAKLLVSDMVANVMHDPDALLWMTHLKNRDEYTAMHSMNVSVLSIVFGNHLALERGTLERLGLGGLLHDMGKLRVPLDVLNKPDRLTDREFELIQEHPAHGLDILQHSKGLAKSVIDVAYSHHERLNGKGYPRKLAADQIGFFSKIVAIVDVYDALTSDRVYRDGMPTEKAMKLLYSLAGKEFEHDLIEQFVQCLGLYPSGSLVELETGEVGVVIPVDRKQFFKPIVLLILDADKQKYYPLKIVDYKLFDHSLKGRQIKQELQPGTYGLYSYDYAEEIAAAV